MAYCPVCGSAKELIEERYTWVICGECGALLELMPGGFGEPVDSCMRVVSTDKKQIEELLGYNYIAKFNIQKE